MSIKSPNGRRRTTDDVERRRESLALRDSEQRFRMIAETISEVFWIADVDLSTMVYVSPGYERIWGVRVDELYRNPPSFLDAIHSEDRDRVVADLAVEKEGLPFDHEYRIVRPDGEIRWIWDRGFPVPNDTGPVLHYVGVAQDITARMRDEARLRRSEQRLRATFEQAAVGMVELSIGGRVIRVNQRLCAILGCSAQDLLQCPFDAVIAPDDRALEATSRERLRSGALDTDALKLRLLRKGGPPVWMESTISFVHDPTGEPAYFLIVLRDITEERALQSQLLQSQKMEALGQLAGGVAHDFNNILTVINGQADIVLQDEHLRPEHRNSLQEVLEASRRAGELTRKLLFVSRRQVMQPRLVDVNDIARGLRPMLTRLIREDIQLRFDLDPHPLISHADPALIEQVLLNLTLNARDAIAAGGAIVVATARTVLDEDAVKTHPHAAPGAHVGITVSDTGSGIPPDVMPHIFEPFYSTKGTEGTGLGLATVFGVVQQHRGWIDVESAAGEGTTFRVWLPMLEAPWPSRGAALPAAEPAVRDANATILLVEDQAGVRRVTRRTLERHGYEVVEAEDGDEALRVFDARGGQIDLLLTDMVMPGSLSGRALGALLKARRPQLRVLLTSGHSVDIAGRDVQLAADEHFLEKPFRPSHLIESVTRCLD